MRHAARGKRRSATDDGQVAGGADAVEGTVGGLLGTVVRQGDSRLFWTTTSGFNRNPPDCSGLALRSTMGGGIDSKGPGWPADGTKPVR
jgi:hypothetical protein